ncbi:retron St85 family RNA-directed DNA polymerase [Pectobacterium peruviense]|uniref:RNA-directed DNA polymerase n=1 Tax=Pectobacterium peruviense TaxID=2066479 RepID=A0ABX4S5W7_9GAMM|nr:retron St85 family RNA-directed DNA polymerase [Pectobacterium peruviense]KML64535.1 reverse transcriptase [Pectobacterium peruviense]PKX80767.1 reverse transcriptase [Pectobacterium peruviense]PKX85889.1 reverse transcriptase [Pectobacterium peruviense]
MLTEYLASSLILTTDFIRDVADTADERYNKFGIPKKNGATRVVYQPQKELKILQRVLHSEFLVKLKVHSSSTAYSDGSSVIKNANLHKNKKFLLRLDFVDFFKSIRSSDIRLFLNERGSELSDQWTNDDSDVFLKLVCFKGRLTMGGVTSPAISNLICYKLDSALSEICLSLGVTYSRYADDMYFSTNVPNVLFSMPNRLIKILRSIDYPRSLYINTEKTKHSSKKRSMKITGLTLTNNGEVSLGREKKRRIRSLVFNWSNLTVDEKKYLQGYLSYCASVEPLFINSLCEKFSSKIITNIQKYK